MTISPETLATNLLEDKNVSIENKKALFLKEVIVAVFDGLIIFRGDLNMAEAIPRLKAIAQGLGLPIAVIERNAIQKYNKKKYKVGRHIGPGNFMKASWNNEEGFDFGFKEKYNEHGIEKELEKKVLETYQEKTKPLPINRSHLSSGEYNFSNKVTSRHYNNFSIYEEDEDDDWNRMNQYY
jgi:hypothetical protein